MLLLISLEQPISLCRWRSLVKQMQQTEQGAKPIQSSKHHLEHDSWRLLVSKYTHCWHLGVKCEGSSQQPWLLKVILPYSCKSSNPQACFTVTEQRFHVQIGLRTHDHVYCQMHCSILQNRSKCANWCSAALWKILCLGGKQPLSCWQIWETAYSLKPILDLVHLNAFQVLSLESNSDVMLHLQLLAHHSRQIQEAGCLGHYVRCLKAFFRVKQVVCNLVTPHVAIQGCEALPWGGTYFSCNGS